MDEEIEALDIVPENPGLNKENEALENAPENPGVALENAPENTENTEVNDEENEALENAPENPGVNGQQAEPGPNDDEIEEQTDEQYGARTREGLQSRRERNFGHLFATVEEKDPDRGPPCHTSNVHEERTQDVWQRRGSRSQERNVTVARPKSDDCQKDGRSDPRSETRSAGISNVPETEA